MNQAYDLSPSAFPPELDWSAGNQEETLRRLYDFVMQECSASISWYYRKKGSKKWFGLLLRLGVILSAAEATAGAAAGCRMSVSPEMFRAVSLLSYVPKVDKDLVAAAM
ncbi:MULTISPECIES: hypothetical protein [unclassified Synechococcus]|uniref:hypothetical protein n=1 Tax=unclassified Synechococcus TaxID=2626047 RepID=UPI000069963A|nr:MULTISPECIES: hypothetical protein [unclassified Synechococcus]EAQ75268.1 hypothetical protein WH5701_09299 [Synechococcus sp. WH 5701]WFN57853.1 hypothetical protein N4320_08280 [Synechococcus sp. CCFWC 502]